jgi:hypothetical protein
MRRVPISLLLLLSLLAGSVTAPAPALPDPPSPLRSGAPEWRAPDLAGSLGISSGKPLRSAKFYSPHREAAVLPSPAPLPLPAFAGRTGASNSRTLDPAAGAPGLARAPPSPSYL